MRKFLKLTFDFINSAKLKMAFFALICTLMWCVVAFMCGKLMYSGEKYEKLVVADIENMLYFSATVPQSDDASQIEESLREIKESILAIDGVVSILERPAVFRYVYPALPELSSRIWFDAIRITEELYEKFEPVIEEGEGFDYSSPVFEMIITGPGENEWQEGWQQVGTGIGFSYGWDGKSFAQDENGNTLSQSFEVIGKAEPDQFYPTLESVSEILTQTNAVLIKDSEYTRERIDQVFPESVKITNEYCGLIELKAGITDEEKQAVIEAIQKFGSNDEGDDLLSAIKERVSDDMLIYLPSAITATVVFIAALVCLATRSIYVHADNYAIWRTVGASKRGSFYVTFTAFSFVIVVSYLAAVIIISGAMSSPFLSQYLERTIIGIETVFITAAFSAAVLVIVAVVSYVSAKIAILRMLKSKYKG